MEEGGREKQTTVPHPNDVARIDGWRLLPLSAFDGEIAQR
jgi:hypothetical protein